MSRGRCWVAVMGLLLMLPATLAAQTTGRPPGLVGALIGTTLPPWTVGYRWRVAPVAFP